jgi:hypothetical protein
VRTRHRSCRLGTFTRCLLLAHPPRHSTPTACCYFTAECFRIGRLHEAVTELERQRRSRPSTAGRGTSPIRAPSATPLSPPSPLPASPQTSGGGAAATPTEPSPVVGLLGKI